MAVPTLPPIVFATRPTPADSPSPTIALLQSHSLAGLVQQEIERQILAGVFAPGDKLAEAAIADRLGVSRGPVREAFCVLEEAGLVRQEKNRGAFVRQVPLDEALEIFDVRAMIDEAVGRTLALQAHPDQLAILQALLERMERLVRAGQAAGYALANLEFHDTLVVCAGNRRLVTLYRKLMNELSLFRRLNLADGTQLPASVAEHRRILETIAAGNADAAAAAMRQHVLRSKARTIQRHTPVAAPPSAPPSPITGAESPR